MFEYRAFLIKYAEIGVKGKNRYLFEDALVGQIANALKKIEGDYKVYKQPGRVFVEAGKGSIDYEGALDALKRVMGVLHICPIYIVDSTDLDKAYEEVVNYIGECYPTESFTFKVMAKRSNKKMPKTSPEISADIGGLILEKYGDRLSVDVKNPDKFITIELRDKAYIYSETIKGEGGLPIGTAGKAMCLLSGGIDSPVAAYMMARRGVKVEAVYFHAPPYTSERAKQKVVDLARLTARYVGSIKLYVVNFTDIQLAIYEKCPHDELTIIMRRYMMKIAEDLALKDECFGLVTGESIGQVASQTMQSLLSTNAVCSLPVYRPVICFDKQDIINISQRIGTFETSILPFEDCCTIFVAEHPVTKPLLSKIEKDEKKLDDVIDELYKKAVDSVEIINCEPMEVE